MPTFLDFERSIAELDSRIAELREGQTAGAIEPEIEKLQAKSDKMLRDVYAKLTPWQKTQVARHPERPHFKDYVAGFVEDFMPLAGDRAFADDKAIIGGFGKIGGRRCMVIGHEKGDDTASRLKHNFGMAEQGLQRAQVRAALQQMRREGVAQDVGADPLGRDTGVGGKCLDQLE